MAGRWQAGTGRLRHADAPSSRLELSLSPGLKDVYFTMHPLNLGGEWPRLGLREAPVEAGVPVNK